MPINAGTMILALFNEDTSDYFREGLKSERGSLSVLNELISWILICFSLILTLNITCELNLPIKMRHILTNHDNLTKLKTPSNAEKRFEMRNYAEVRIKKAGSRTINTLSL
jgi:hypothetical protein